MSDGVTLEEVLWIKTMVRLRVTQAGKRWAPLTTNVVSEAAKATIGEWRWSGLASPIRSWIVGHIRWAYGLEYVGMDGQHYNRNQGGPRDTVFTKPYPGRDAQIRAYELAEQGGQAGGGEPGAGAAVVGAGGAGGPRDV